MASGFQAGHPAQCDNSVKEFAIFKPKRLSFEELSERLNAYEKKYGYSTVEFHVVFWKRSFHGLQIAEKLFITENTIKGHVSNILSKLHLADRIQVAVYAWQKGIVMREGGG